VTAVGWCFAQNAKISSTGLVHASASVFATRLVGLVNKSITYRIFRTFRIAGFL
jgi:hypothetical protein